MHFLKNRPFLRIKKKNSKVLPKTKLMLKTPKIIYLFYILSCFFIKMVLFGIDLFFPYFYMESLMSQFFFFISNISQALWNFLSASQSAGNWQIMPEWFYCFWHVNCHIGVSTSKPQLKPQKSWRKQSVFRIWLWSTMLASKLDEY